MTCLNDHLITVQVSNLTLKISEHKVEPHYFSVTLRKQPFPQKSVHITWKEVIKQENNEMFVNTMQHFAVYNKCFSVDMYLSPMPFSVTVFVVKLIYVIYLFWKL